VCREEKRFTAICLIDLKLLEANLAVNEERYHPVALRERYDSSLSLCVFPFLFGLSGLRLD
jgi:hypothetical protein